MSVRRCFHFGYCMPRRKNRDRCGCQVRDSAAATHLVDALRDHGYRYGGTIFNHPSTATKVILSDYSVTEDDLILLTTRPPMNDSEVSTYRVIERSYTDYEVRLFEGPLKERFATCSRPEVKLTEDTAAISPEIAKRYSMEFRQNAGAMYGAYTSLTGESRPFKQPHGLTAAFLVYEKRAWPGGPQFLAAFGMGGRETFVWCYQLAARFPHLLLTTPFAMAEMDAGPPVPLPATSAFADAWKVTILGAAPAAPERGPEGPGFETDTTAFHA